MTAGVISQSVWEQNISKNKEQLLIKFSGNYDNVPRNRGLNFGDTDVGHDMWGNEPPTLPLFKALFKAYQINQFQNNL